MPAEPRTSRLLLTSRRPLLLLAIATVVGIAADRVLGQQAIALGLWIWWLGAGGCLLVGAIGFQQQRCWRVTLLLIAAAGVGGGWHHLRWHYYEHDHLARFATEVSQPVCLQAVAVDRLQFRPAPPANPLRAMPTGPRSELTVSVLAMREGRRWRDVSGTCRLRVDGELHGIDAGDRLRIFALMGRPTPALNPGQYDWAEAERGAGRYCDLFCKAPECVSVIEVAAGWSGNEWLHQLGRRCEHRLTTYVWPEQAALAQAILLGARERLDRGTYEDFIRTGTVHLLVVSGLHVGLLAIAIWTVVGSGWLPRREGLLLTACLIVGYALIVGARPPVVRASVLVVMTLASYLVGRRISIVNLLAAATLLVLAINPSELFRSGTQLSFVCVATLAAYGAFFQNQHVADPLQRLIRDAQPAYRKLLRGMLRSMVHTAQASLAIWIIVAPLIAYHFNITAPISILINPLLWPLVALALILGLTICSVGWLIPPLASVLGELCSCCLWGTESIVAVARQLEGGNWYLPGPATWWVLVFYLGLMLAAPVCWQRVRWTWQVSVAAVWIAIGLFTAGWKSTDEQLRCTFLSVGHGACVVLELPGGETMLYDAGSLGSPERASQTIASFLWSRGITRLDAVVLSHADVDHYNALPGLVERFEVAKVYVSPLMFSPWITAGQLDAPNYLKQTLTAADVPLEEIWINDRLRTAHPDIEIEVLHPPRRGVLGRDNANSLLLAIRYAGRSILLPGDLESPGIEAVMAERPQAFDVLLAPHHGSRNSDPPGFAAWCTPKWVVVSGPRANPAQQFTADSYRRVGAKVLHTAGVGAVEFVIDRQRLECLSFVSNPAGF